jgi:hypothetical protein
VMSYIGSFGPMKSPLIPGEWDTLIVVIGAIILFYWGVNSALPKPSFETDTEGEAPPKFE